MKISLLRPPAFAGTFYPQDAHELDAEVSKLLEGTGPALSPPRAVIAPHAGYRFSGRLMAQALAAAAVEQPKFIAILSPSHRYDFNGIAVPGARQLAWPGGQSDVAHLVCKSLVDAGFARVDPSAHAREHGIEVMLPVIARLFPDVPLVPLVLGRVSVPRVAATVDVLAKQKDALFVVSSDLSHFLTHEEAQARDKETSKKIECGETATLTPKDACGSKAISGFFASKAAQGCRITRLGCANSADITGQTPRTVGYGAWLVSDARADCLPQGARAALLRLARQALQSRLTKGKPPFINVASFPSVFQGHAASFVTLEQGGRLRGCVGSLKAHAPLALDVVVNAQKAALDDKRFTNLTAEELQKTVLKIAVLSPPTPLEFDSQEELEAQIQPNVDGLILRDGARAGIFLPMVWDKIPDAHDFIEALKVKAGLERGHWSGSLTVQRFSTEVFSDQDQVTPKSIPETA